MQNLGYESEKLNKYCGHYSFSILHVKYFAKGNIAPRSLSQTFQHEKKDIWEVKEVLG